MQHPTYGEGVSGACLRPAGSFPRTESTDSDAEPCHTLSLYIYTQHVERPTGITGTDSSVSCHWIVDPGEVKSTFLSSLPGYKFRR